MKRPESIHIMLFVVFVSIILTFLVFYYLFSRNSESSATQQLVASNTLAEENFNQYFDDVESLLLVIDDISLTHEVFVGECRYDNISACVEFQEYFKILDDSHTNVNGIYFFDLNGETLVSTSEDSMFEETLSAFLDRRSFENDNLFLPIKTYRSRSYNQIYFSDFFDSTGKTFMFALLVVYNEIGQAIGSVILEVPVESIDTLFQANNSLANSQETYLVGADFVMRTNSRFSETPTRLSQIIKTENTQNCFSGVASTQKFSLNHSDISVLGVSTYIPRFDWCLMSEIDKQEVTQVRNILIKILILLGVIFIGTLLMFFEKITQNTNFLKRKQLDLKEALFEKQKFQRALDAASDNVFILDIHGNVIYMNRAVSSHSGFMPKKTLGKRIDALWWAGVDPKLIDEIFETLFVKKQAGSWELTSLKKNGTGHKTEIFATPVVEEGELLFTLVIEHDIQKRKELESLKDEFIAIVSHELRTPMTIVRGYVSLLLDNVLGPTNSKQKEMLQKIDTSSAKLIELVTDMLDMSKFEKQEDEEIKKEYFDVRDVLSEVSDEFKVLMAEKDISYDVSYGTYTKIDSDPKLLKHIFVNLIGNAFKFTDNGGHIHVNVVGSQDDSFIRVEVVDDGIGIPESYRSMIFEKFSQVENYLTKKNEGTGLGLPICKKIVTMLGGMISFKNNPEKGTTFYFELPRE